MTALNEIKKSNRVKIIELSKDEKSNFSSFLKSHIKKITNALIKI